MTAYALIDGADRNTGIDLTAALTTPGGLTGDTFAPGGDVYLRVKTGGSNPIAVAINWPTAADAYGVGKANLSLNGGSNIPISSDRVFGPFPAGEFADPSDGQVHVTYTGTLTGTTVGVYRATNG
jgi:hypothetical protein